MSDAANIDLEKQGRDAATTPSAHSEAREELYVRQETDSSEDVEKRGLERQPSTRFAPQQAPVYRGADGEEVTAKPTRTFSRRAARDASDAATPFGGDLSISRTEMTLERFKSQKGKVMAGEPVVVHWEGDDDPENPQNFSKWYKIYLTLFGALLVLNSTFTSSCPSGIVPMMINYFQFSEEVATLTISLWVAGYCLGPLIWGPLSERLGRKPVFVVSVFMYTIWNMGCALAKNTASILVFRFLGGVFGAAPLTNSGGIIADVWDAKARGIALSFFSIAPFAGPAIGPIVSGAIQVRMASWRYVYWTCMAFSGVCLLLVIFTVRETYAPTILTRKAKRIRKETGQDFYKSPLELTPLDPKHLLHDTLLFPFVMLFQEPILMAFGLYLSFVYGIIYLLFGAYPFVFEQVHGFNALQEGLTFIPLFLGGVVGVIFYVAIMNPRYVAKVEQYAREGKGRVPPEERLKIVCIAAPCLVISFFWLGWTSYRSISFWSPMMAGSLLGFAILLIFLGIFNGIIDIYLAKAASGLAGNTVMRSAFGAGFPLFTSQMFKTLGIQWACTLLGGLSLLMLPIPFALVKWGPKIRSWSKHAAS